MPSIHGGMQPGTAMALHLSFGITILAVIVLRFFWKLIHPVTPQSSLPAWQRLMSEGVHWLLYALVFATTISGWVFASFRGWPVSYFWILPLPMLASQSADNLRRIDGLHQMLEWALLIAIVVHVVAALAHIFIYRDKIMQRMLPATKNWRIFASDRLPR